MGDRGECIIYESPGGKEFIIDLPHSITAAQNLTSCEGQLHDEKSSKARRYAISSPALQSPHPTTTEPKSESARQKILARIPPSELGTVEYQKNIIEPLVKKSLASIHSEYVDYASQAIQLEWALPRQLIDDASLQKQQNAYIELPSIHQDGQPPLILSSGSTTLFSSIADLAGVVKNPSQEKAELVVGNKDDPLGTRYLVPPESNFVLCNIPLSEWSVLENPIPGLSRNQRFNLILMDPPWPNRSARRSHAYQIASYTDLDTLKQRVKDILRVHTYEAPLSQQSLDSADPNSTEPFDNNTSQDGFAAIWITASHKTRAVAYEALQSSGFHIHEEWVWIKTTTRGEPVGPIDGIWRKPYEILVIGKKGRRGGNQSTPSVSNVDIGADAADVPRRVIAAAPDFHSRKPSLRSIFERYLFNIGPADHQNHHYSALEVFARHLTAGWWACGNEVMKFNDVDYWTARDV